MSGEASTLTLRNPWSWYAVTASRDLAPGTAAPIVLNGERMVVWRSRSGNVNAWNDRCPHRGMRLSFGAVHQETLICPYHGWTFGDDAHCVRIPAHPGVAPSRAARARVYPAVETEGYVWVCLGEPATATPSAPAGYESVRTLHFPHPMEDVIAAFMTMPFTISMDPAITPLSEIAWSRDPDLTLPGSTIACSAKLKAEFVAPGTLVCEAADESGKSSYIIRVHQTEPGLCAVHASSTTADRLSFNRALVGFRAAIGQPEFAPWLHSARRKFDEMIPIHLAGLTQGETP